MYEYKTQAAKLKEVRRHCKDHGAVFKADNVRIKGAQAYKIQDRKTRAVLIRGLTIASAYDNYFLHGGIMRSIHKQDADYL